MHQRILLIPGILFFLPSPAAETDLHCRKNPFQRGKGPACPFPASGNDSAVDKILKNGIGIFIACRTETADPQKILRPDPEQNQFPVRKADIFCNENKSFPRQHIAFHQMMQLHNKVLFTRKKRFLPRKKTVLCIPVKKRSNIFQWSPV